MAELNKMDTISTDFRYPAVYIYDTNLQENTFFIFCSLLAATFSQFITMQTNVFSKLFTNCLLLFKPNDTFQSFGKRTCSCALVFRCLASASARDNRSRCNEPLCHKLSSVAGDKCK